MANEVTEKVLDGETLEITSVSLITKTELLIQKERLRKVQSDITAEMDKAMEPSITRLVEIDRKVALFSE